MEGCGPIHVILPSAVPQQDERPHCVARGLARALRHAGFDRHAALLLLHADAIVSAPGHTAVHAVQWLQRAGGWAKTERLKKFKPLLDRSPLPTLLQIYDSSGDSTHTVAIVGDLIFDANASSPRPLSDEGLNACCLGEATFVRPSYAVRFEPAKALRAEAAQALLARESA